MPTAVLRDKLVSGHGLAEGKVELIPNGIDLRRFMPADTGARTAARKKLSLPPEQRLIGTISRLVWQKGLTFFLDALPALFAAPGMQDVTAVIAGEGPDLPALMARANALGIESKVLFTGFCNDVPAMLATLDVFVLPSLLEGQPITLIEAMAAGKAIVATAIDGVRGTVDNDATGLLVPPRDAHSLTRTLEELLSHPGKSATLGQAARRVAAQYFDIENIVQRYTTFLEQTPHKGENA